MVWEYFRKDNDLKLGDTFQAIWQSVLLVMKCFVLNSDDSLVIIFL